MPKLFLAAAISFGVIGAPVLAYADSSCATMASDKKLAGAAKTSFMNKCAKDDCEKQAADKKLAGAAKTSFTKKCVKDATM